MKQHRLNADAKLPRRGALQAAPFFLRRPGERRSLVSLGRNQILQNFFHIADGERVVPGILDNFEPAIRKTFREFFGEMK